MSFQTFNTSSVNALLTQIRTRVEAAGWTTLRDAVVDSEREMILRSPAGAHVGLRSETAADGSYKNLQLQGYRSSYEPDASFHGQFGAIQHNGSTALCPALPLQNLPLTVWLAISDRRLLIVVKLSSVYVAAHLGYMLPFASDAEYPEPLLIGGSITGGAKLWSGTTDSQNVFLFGRGGLSVGYPRVLLPNGSWQSINFSGNASTNLGAIFPFNGGLEQLGRSFDDSHTMFQALVVSGLPGAEAQAWEGEWLGYIEGVFGTDSEAVTSESQFAVLDRTFMVFPNVFRNSSFFTVEVA
ncbi:hypothetical protein LZL36_10935 [Pseudomonas aeruginosa]|nr:hypothetical protein [Pseudomonas aeruginosa]